MTLPNRRFKANYFNRSTTDDLKLGVKRHEMPRSIKRIHDTFHASKVGKQIGIHHNHEPSLPQLEQRYSETIDKTDVEEVWFAGVHCGMSIDPNENVYDILSVAQMLGVGPSKTARATVWRASRCGG